MTTAQNGQGPVSGHSRTGRSATAATCAGTRHAASGASMAVMVSTPGSDIPPGEYVPTADERVVISVKGWTDFETLLALRGDTGRPRMAYLDGCVELLMPSRGHENI